MAAAGLTLLLLALALAAQAQMPLPPPPPYNIYGPVGPYGSGGPYGGGGMMGGPPVPPYPSSTSVSYSTYPMMAPAAAAPYPAYGMPPPPPPAQPMMYPPPYQTFSGSGPMGDPFTSTTGVFWPFREFLNTLFVTLETMNEIQKESKNPFHKHRGGFFGSRAPSITQLLGLRRRR